MAQVYVGNNNAILLEGLHDEIDGEYLNSANVVVTVKDANGVVVAGAGWPKSMFYIDGTNGNYRAVLEDTIEFAAERKYIAEITANGGFEKLGIWKFPFWAKVRQ